MEVQQKSLTAEFVSKHFKLFFREDGEAIYTSPGRINLIGEHTDYNGGYVFPGAVDKGMIAVISPNNTDKVQAYSIDLNASTCFDLNDQKGPEASWARYIYGVCHEMISRGVPVKGFNAVFAGDVPLGAGMSSSAALESCFAFALNDMFADNKVDKFELAKAGQATEHKYIGVKCGIMDQFASIFGKKGHLIRLDCRSLDYEYFPFDPKGYRLVLLNTCVAHELSSSAYNDRRKSCENVVAHIAVKHPGVETLRDASWEWLEEVKAEISDEDYRCARYVLGEKDRVLTVSEALKKGDYETVGEKMYETHDGLSKDYRVSCPELDFLNEIARECGVSGSRVMGGGFGGCTINLVKDELYNNFIQTAIDRYEKEFGKKPLTYDVVIGDGAKKLK